MRNHGGAVAHRGGPWAPLPMCPRRSPEKNIKSTCKKTTELEIIQEIQQIRKTMQDAWSEATDVGDLVERGATVIANLTELP